MVDQLAAAKRVLKPVPKSEPADLDKKFTTGLNKEDHMKPTGHTTLMNLQSQLNKAFQERRKNQIKTKSSGSSSSSGSDDSDDDDEDSDDS